MTTKIEKGKRVTMAIAADLRVHGPATLKRLTTIQDALNAIALADAMKARYIVFGGRLMNSGAGAVAVPVLDGDHAEEQLSQAVELVDSRLSEFSDTTIWMPLLNEATRKRVTSVIQKEGGACPSPCSSSRCSTKRG